MIFDVIGLKDGIIVWLSEVPMGVPFGDFIEEKAALALMPAQGEGTH